MAESTKKTAAPKAAPKAAESVEAAAAAGKETVETVVKASAEAAQKGVKKAVAMGQEQVAAAVKAGTNAFKDYEDVVAFGKDNVDAIVQANTILVKGAQDINKVFLKLVQDTMEDQMVVAKKLMSAKTPKDFAGVQASVAKARYTKALDEGRKISDMTVKLAEEASAPITKQVNAAVEKISKPLAA